MFGISFGFVGSRKFRSILFWMRLLFVAGVFVAAVMLYRSVCEELHRSSVMVVNMEGTHHIGSNFNIAGFYLNGYEGGIVGREGFSGDMCCVTIPKKWKPGLVIEVRWAIGDWNKENRAEIAVQNYKIITYTCFKAVVPVEKYETADRVFVHFFRDGKVRVVSSMAGVLGISHPIQRGDSHAADTATVGQRVDAIFTDAEIAEMDRQNYNRSYFFGNWR